MCTQRVDERPRRRPLQVPLVDDDDEPAALLPRACGDAHVLVGRALDSVEHDDGNVGAPEHLERLGRGELLDALVNPRTSAQAGGVDEDVARAVRLEQRVDGVAGRPGALVDEGTRVAEEAVHERRLADVRAADDADADGGIFHRRRGCRHTRENRLDQLRDAVSVFGGYGDEIGRAEPVELARRRFPARRVELVHDEDDARPAAAQLARRRLVRRGEPGLAVEHVDDERGVDDRREAPLAHGDVETGRALGLEAAGVDEKHRAVVEDRHGLVGVARDARSRIDERLPTPQQAIEERRLAGVRPPDDRDPRQRRGRRVGVMRRRGAGGRGVTVTSHRSRHGSRRARRAPLRARAHGGHAGPCSIRARP